MRRTKIVATLGPATDTPERIGQLIAAGMDVARLNFSHGTHKEHAARIATVRSEAAKAGRPVGILQDLQGPKIRTGTLREGRSVQLTSGRPFTITVEAITGDGQRVSTTYAALPRDVRAGDRILLSDGAISLQVIETSDTEVHCEVVDGGELREHQGINLPGVAVSAPSLGPKDLQDLAFGLQQGVDYVGLSFVRRASDIREAKEAIARAGKDTPLIAKIEKPEALEVLDDILRLVDGVMVARGDLGVEIPPEQVPPAQKHIIAEANRAAIPVITATQMLQSMIDEPRPTRAEVSDVANAILDGSDAVMLSGETAIGRYPVEAVQMMARIAEATEPCGCGARIASPAWPFSEIESLPEAVGIAVRAIAQSLPVVAIWVFTLSGSTARLVAHQRPEVPIVAFTPNETTYQRLSLLWGVTPLKSTFVHSEQEYYQQIYALAQTRNLAQMGDLVVLTGGHPIGRGGPTNFIEIMRLSPDKPTFVQAPPL
jgi:pyruvate kinase